MPRLTILAVIVCAVLPGVRPLAVTAAEPDASRRYTLRQVEEGIIRLDTQTGAVTACRRADGRWVCEAVADPHLDLQRQLDREIAANKALRQEIEDLKARLERAQPDATEPEVQPHPTIPPEEQVDEMMSALEKMIRKFQEMLKSLERQPSEKQL